MSDKDKHNADKYKDLIDKLSRSNSEINDQERSKIPDTKEENDALIHSPNAFTSVFIKIKAFMSDNWTAWLFKGIGWSLGSVCGAVITVLAGYHIYNSTTKTYQQQVHKDRLYNDLLVNIEKIWGNYEPLYDMTCSSAIPYNARLYDRYYGNYTDAISGMVSSYFKLHNYNLISDGLYCKLRNFSEYHDQFRKVGCKIHMGSIKNTIGPGKVTHKSKMMCKLDHTYKKGVLDDRQMDTKVEVIIEAIGEEQKEHSYWRQQKSSSSANLRSDRNAKSSLCQSFLFTR